VTAEPPDRNLGGGSIREAYLLEALAKEVETHLLLAGTLDDQRTRSALAGVTEVDIATRPLPRGRSRRRVDDLRRVLLDHEPADVIENRSRVRGLAGRLQGLGSFDLVCIEHDRLAPLIAARAADAGRWVLTLQNLPSERKADELSLARSRRQRWLYRRELADARRFEAEMVDAYDRVVVPSKRDVTALGGRAVVIPNGVDTGRFRPTPLPASRAVVFTGTLSWWPNIEGLTWFCDAVLPLVRASVPDSRFDIVGREPLPEVRALGQRPGVAVHADVASVVPWLEQARVAVVPLRIGSGTRLKALEAMASSRPVAGTSVGLEGLGIEAGTQALVADDPALLAAAIVQLLTDDALANRVAAAGAEYTRERFAWVSIGRRFVDTLLELVQRQAR
jgi:glycosyltransferase involved in cell wall biosynthesis